MALVLHGATQALHGRRRRQGHDRGRALEIAPGIDRLDVEETSIMLRGPDLARHSQRGVRSPIDEYFSGGSRAFRQRRRINIVTEQHVLHVFGIAQLCGE